MRIRTTLWIALLSAMSCDNTPTGGEEQPPTGLPPGGGQGCRNYATEWSTSINVTGNPTTTTSAQFNPSTFMYSERSPAPSGPEQVRLTYWSVSDFIDEAAVMARYLFRRLDRCAGSNCAGVSSYLPTYDSQRRMKTLTLVGNGFPLWVENYAQWDSVGRPIAGTRTTPICTETLRIVYDDVARTFEKGPVYSGGSGLCGLSAFQRFTFDQHNNVVAEYVATGGASTTWTHTITSMSMACKPD
jgi:hypothetical protein